MQERQKSYREYLQQYFPGWIDKRTIIYSQARPSESAKVYQIDVEDGNKTNIMDLESFYARFSPDGERLAVINSEKGVIQVYSTSGESLQVVELVGN